MPRRIPPLNALRAFEATARLGTLTAAADELAVTPSAVGHQVKSLEEWFGAPLFANAGRRRTLTPRGERLAAELTGALDRLDLTCRALLAREDKAGLHVNVTPTFAIRWLVPRLGRFQARHPHIPVRISIGFDAADFRREDADAALRFGRGPWPGLAADLLFPEDVFPVCSPALLGGERALADPRSLRHHTLLHTAHRRGDWGRWLAAAGVPRGEVDPDAGPVFDLTTMAIDAAEAGMGVAITREAQVTDALRAGRLAAPLPRDLLRGEGCYLLCEPARRDEPPLAAFREWLLEQAKGRE